MQFVIILLRLVHIVAGAFWAGSALMMALVILPGVRKAGPGGERTLPMAAISRAMSLAALLTTIAGLLLYVGVSRFFAWDWISSPQGIGFTIGSLAGLAAFLLGLLSTAQQPRRSARWPAKCRRPVARPSRSRRQKWVACKPS